jgi:hypothetical protein
MAPFAALAAHLHGCRRSSAPQSPLTSTTVAAHLNRSRRSFPPQSPLISTNVKTS